MRSLPLLLFVIAIAYSPVEPIEQCELIPQRALLYVDEQADAYRDISSALRAGRIDDVIRSAPSSNGHVTTSRGQKPLICKTDTRYAKTIRISYPPRRPEREVGAIVELHYNDRNDLRIAELYVIGLAP